VCYPCGVKINDDDDDDDDDKNFLTYIESYITWQGVTSLKKYRLAAGLCPDPLGDLAALPQTT